MRPGADELLLAFNVGHFQGTEFGNDLAYSIAGVITTPTPIPGAGLFKNALGRLPTVVEATATRYGVKELGERFITTKRVATASPVGLADDLLKYAGNVQPKAGFTDVLIHSDANGFAVLHNGKWVDLTHRDVANFITSKGITGDIRLISCEAGQSGLAQNLANKLGVSVEAATTKVGIYKYQFGEVMVLDGGIWKTFIPGTKP